MSVAKKPRLDLEPEDTLESDFFGYNLPRPKCEYGEMCYRKNRQHLKEFRHAQVESLYIKMRAIGEDALTEENLERFPDIDILFDQLSILRDLRRSVVGQTEEKSQSLEPNPSTSAASRSSSQVHPNSVSKPRSISESFPSSSPKSFQPPPSKPSTSSAMFNSFESPGRSLSAKPAAVAGGMLAKLEASAPFNFFLTSIPTDSSEAPLTVCFRDLFHPSLGKVKSVLHFNYMVEAEWFIDQCLRAKLDSDVDMMVIYGVESRDLKEATNVFPWLKAHVMKSPFPYGHHHTKMIFIKYTDDSLRFVVCTANLIESDWDNRTQGVWISPKCPNLSGSGQMASFGESVTSFRADLLQYLGSYPAAYLGSWLQDIRSCDCRLIKVAFIGSVPVSNASPITGFNMGLKKMDKVLKKAGSHVESSDWPLLMQCSSIGSLGGSTDAWLRTEFASHVVGNIRPESSFPIFLIYPSLANVKGSFDGLHGGGCLPYAQSTHSKQPWLQNLLYQWKSDSRQRSRAMPHIKTYCRISPDRKKISWFLLTSANLSKAAWGKLNKAGDRLTLMSWEAGVLFIPKYIGTPDQETFDTRNQNISNSTQSTPVFPFPYDLPLTKYTSTDTPWFFDILNEASRS